MSEAIEHIVAWEAAGLIDQATADRLRAAEPVPTTRSTVRPPAERTTPMIRSAASRLFGPGVTIAEVFGYLGGGFLIAAWSAFMASSASAAADPETTLVVLGLIAAAVLTGLALRARGMGERASRAAGVLLLVALGFVSGAAFAFLDDYGLEWPAIGVIVSALVLLVAIAYRLLHPSTLTQLGMLASVTSLAGALLAWLQATVFPIQVSETTGQVTSSGPDPIFFVIASAAWWLSIAAGIGLLGLAEARGAGKPGDSTASSRAAATRFWAGLLAVIGLSMAISQSHVTVDGSSGRVLEPIVGDIALLILSAVLIERAFRRDATSYIYAAALGLIVALTDFNVSYLADSTEAALLAEGLILLGVGVGADRLRRRVGDDGAATTSGPTAGSSPEQTQGIERVADSMPAISAEQTRPTAESA